MKMTSNPAKATFRAWIVWLFAAAFYFYEFMIQVSPGIMATDLMREFQIHASSLGNLSAYYFYSYASMQLVVGVVLDRWGPRRLLSISSLLCMLGCFLFANAETLGKAEFSRFIIGMGSAAAVVSSFKLATSWFPTRFFGVITGLTVMIGMLGAVFGEAPLAWLVQHSGWRSAMNSFAFAGLLIAGLIWLVVRDAPANIKLSSEDRPLIPLKETVKTVLGCKQTWLTSIYGGLMFAPTTALGALWGVNWMIGRYGFDRHIAAQVVSYLFLGWAAGGPLSGVLTNYFGRCKTTMYCGSSGALFTCLALIYIDSWSAFTLRALWFMFGFFSAGFLPFMTIIKRNHSFANAGAAMGFGNCMNMIGGALLQPLIGVLLDYHWGGEVSAEGLRIYTASDYSYALTIVPLLLGSALLALYFVKEPAVEAHPELDPKLRPVPLKA